MINFFRSLFGASIPSTRKYEARLNDIEQAYACFVELENSTEYKRYLELRNTTSSPDFSRKLNEIKRLSYKGSPEWSAKQKYKRLKKNKDVKGYLKTSEGETSTFVKEYLALEALLKTEEFVQRKNYLTDKNRHKLSEQYQQLEEYQQLSKSKTVTDYTKLKKRYEKTFAERDSWDITFEENFALSPFSKQWSTSPYWTEHFLKMPYSQAAEKQLPTDGTNLESQGGLLSVVTRKEEANGLAWDSKFGFIPKTFGYTSGIVNTPKTFRQQYGRFVTKVRLSRAKNIYHAFWMGAEKMLPHITIFKVENGKMQAASYTEANKTEKQLGYKIKEDFYIFELIWNQTTGLSWLINGKKVYSTAISPDMPLYLAFSSGVTDDVPENELPQRLSIEWVRCYQKK
ncbi:MAG: family 16 glycosylhydrolase [Prevotellaceae bacterium]|jgi:hypothetical protein|nr:family 16 glycosylhydrolase [Prevotellaceae bacterium]